MKQRIILTLVLVLLSVLPVLAREKSKDKQEVAPAAQTLAQTETTKQQKEILIANINNMRNEEIRVAVLRQLLNEEIAKLNSAQEAFCKQYKLDVEKLRKGLYRYDERQGKFVEIKPDK